MGEIGNKHLYIYEGKRVREHDVESKLHESVNFSCTDIAQCKRDMWHTMKVKWDELEKTTRKVTCNCVPLFLSRNT